MFLRAAIYLLFFFNAFGFGSWLARIPDMRDRLGIDYFWFSICLMALPFAMLMAFPFAAGIIRKIGVRHACRFVGSGFLLMIMAPGAASTPYALFIFGLFVGAFVPVIEVAINAAASHLEKDNGWRIMSRCHGFWSIGIMTGSAMGGLFASYEIDIFSQQLVLMPLAAILSFIAGSLLPQLASQEEPKSKRFNLAPSMLILSLCPLGGLLIEGTFLEWSAMLGTDILELTTGRASWLLFCFSAAMALARFYGDATTSRLGENRMLVASSLAGMAGTWLFALGGSFTLTCLGAIFAGFGVANVYPIAISRAGRVKSDNAETNIATLAAISFGVFLAGPPMIGILARLMGLDMAFALIGPISLLPILYLLLARPRAHS